ncbi:protein phosphatase 2c domain-containing [Cystoisospora suis]|uniref:Protein phosphatase 2c domain-containing n=1 Tax=Cystoisospora suis TaxID=483139 RepID=A0A2C6KSS7_9APIC|nr:protein phosphatase 2c domain-containing [Cystoisospora suis]
MFRSGYGNALAAMEGQGVHTDTPANVNVVGMGNMELLPGRETTGTQDSQVRQRSASTPIESLHRAFLDCLVARTLVRWHKFRQRAMVRAQELKDYLKQLEILSTEFAPHLSSQIVEDFIGTMRLQQILDWIVKHRALDVWGDCPQDATEFDMDSPPHYLTVSSVEDLEASAEEAFIQTGYEQHHRDGNELAKFCFINPMLDIERILTMLPGEVKEADTDLFCRTDSHSRKNCRHSTLFVRSMTVGHPGDARAVLVFSDGDTLEVTEGSHGPCCARSVNLSAFKNGEARGKFGWEAVGGPKTCEAKKAPLALVLGRGRFFDVWTDHEVAQACTQPLCWLREHQPNMALGDARLVVSRLLTKEATVRGGNREHIHGGVDLLDSLGFPDSSPPLPPCEPSTRALPPPPPPVASRQCYRQPVSQRNYPSFLPQGEVYERSGDGRGWGGAGCRRRGGMCGWGGLLAGSIRETLQSVFASYTLDPTGSGL